MTVTTALLLVQWNLSRLQPVLYLWSLFMAVSVAIIAHNHNHVPLWKSRILNVLTDYWLTVFYGFPAFGWIPTHNKNHHHLNNKQGDYTITYRISEKNNLWTLLSYPSISSYFQQKPIATYLQGLRRSDRPKFYLAVSQYLVLAIYYIAALLFNWKKALLFYRDSPPGIALPACWSSTTCSMSHTDEESKYNHARNFVGLINLMLFNNVIPYHPPRIPRHPLERDSCRGKKKIQNLIDPSAQRAQLLVVHSARLSPRAFFITGSARSPAL